MKKLVLFTIAALSAGMACGASPGYNDDEFEHDPVVIAAIDAMPIGALPTDLLHFPKKIERLTEADYRAVAAELGIEVAAMKAVVEIEAGPSHQGFHEAGKPIINFDLTMFRRMAGRRGISLTPFTRTHPEVFARPSVRKYGSMQAGQQARLASAWEIDSVAAAEGTFWGMFQIGGFNWDKCGASSLDDFVKRMSLSEREQLELFAAFLKSTRLDRHLRDRNWAAFARGYNGPAYASRRYHTRLAAAYEKYKKKEK